ncbi:probable terpene synthase 2 [Prosopis cineraria]|uniref:probable terpene synthase 2 n=1 Tax=Prosopis cineraria TaxID=364024 RepID=UPI0024109410|nr:probable terpene synthase 2 [Prosopis cineraria]
MFISSNRQSRSEILNFIELIQRFGVSYHFEQEIEEALAKIQSIYTSNNNILIMHQDGDDDLHSLALLFRLLRQHGYPISSDVFERFKDDKGEFNINQNLTKDVKGMLALYEAAQLEVHGENIFDEALHFTYTHLKSLTDNNQLSPILNAQVSHCLNQPLHKRLLRLAARHYMSSYQRQHPSPNHTIMLLNFAKLDFNMLQKLHRKELGNITKLVGKLAAIIVFLDDTYDVYGKLEELEPFTEAIHRFKCLIKYLPECMKVVFEAVVELCSEMEMVTAKQGTSTFVMPHVKPAFFNLANACLMEAEWCHEHYVPSYEEYKDNGAASSAFPLLLSSFLGLGNLATKVVFEWLATDPKIIRTVSTIGRLKDDMVTHKFEQEREHVASGVDCCMNQFGASEEEAYKMLNDDIKNCWKDINEQCLNNPHNVPKSVLDCVINLARTSEVVYENQQDRFTDGESLKHYVVQLLL